MADGFATETSMPMDLDAERAILGAILLDDGYRDGVLWRVTTIVRPEDFADPSHALVMQALEAVGARGEAIDLVTVGAELRHRNRFHTIGGERELLRYTDVVCTTAHCETHAHLVANASKARRAIHAAQAMVARARLGDTSSLAADATALVDIATADTSGDLAPISDAVSLEDARMVSMETEEVVPTGLPSLDALLAGGLWAAQLIVLGARPSVGKSALMLVCVLAAARQCLARGSGVVLLVSLEMPQRDLAMRLAAIVAAERGAPVDLRAIRARSLGSADSAAYADALEAVRRLPIVICDRRDTRPSQVRAMALRLRAQHGSVALVAVDYLQKMEPERPHDSREREVAESSRILAALAGAVKVPVLALSQLNRKAAEKDRRPTMADLRESGAVEQDADVILLLHREEGQRSRPVLLLEKQRNGPAPDELPLGWEPAAARFCETTTPAARRSLAARDYDMPEDVDA